MTDNYVPWWVPADHPARGDTSGPSITMPDGTVMRPSDDEPFIDVLRRAEIALGGPLPPVEALETGPAVVVASGHYPSVTSGGITSGGTASAFTSDTEQV